MMKRFFRRTRLAVALLVTILAVMFHVRWYQPVGTAQRITKGELAQLQFLRNQLSAGAAQKAQRHFPEGYFFLNVLYGLSWAQVARENPNLTATALAEMHTALANLESAEGTAPFFAIHSPRLGVFHAGWTNWLRGLIIRVDPAFNLTLLDQFNQGCTDLAAAFDRADTPFLESYRNQAWPCDSVVAIAALRLHDAIHNTDTYAPTIDRWLTAARNHLDPVTGLLPHRITPTFSPPRGTSQSIIQRFLPEIDPTFANEQYLAFRKTFVAHQLAMPAIREYPTGIRGPGDVDSGPLIFGISLSASIVAAGAARIHNDSTLADPIFQTCEAAGHPFTMNNAKRYAFGTVPVGDAFIVWSKLAAPWTTPTHTPPVNYPTATNWYWRLPLTAITLLLVGLLWLPLCRDRRTACKHAG